MSSRVRIHAAVAVAALAAAGIAVAVAWTGRGDDRPAAAERTGPRGGTPPLALDVLVEDASEAAALQEAVGLYDAGRLREAREAFEAVRAADSASLYAGVGAAFARWPDGTLDALRALEDGNPASGLVKLHLGLALFWQGKDGEARAAWQAAEEDDPDSPAAVRAESLLHPEMPAGRPFFVPGEAPPADVAGFLPLQQLAELGRRAEQRDDARSWIAYGVALQRAGRPVSARDAFDRAVAADPASVDARAAAAVVRFDKDDPSQAFSKLGPLSQEAPDAPVVRFHLGLLLLWLREIEDARTQLEAARRAAPDSVYGREATLLLDRLSEAQGQTAP